METPRKDKLRTGFTTGACAAAAAKAAGFGLLSGVVPQEVEIRLPIGQTARFCVHHAQTSGDGALASVIKDAGDDPDVTHGAEIVAEASWIMAPGEVRVEGGGGVGVVTKPGLGLVIGGWAVNPVPRKMIRNAIQEALGDKLIGKGARVVVSVPGGEELAKKTLNPRLGILGGISILGVTGIVKPYSTAAFKASIHQALRVARASGLEWSVLTTGDRTEGFAMALFQDLPKEGFIQMGDFVHFAQASALRLGFKRITVVAMIGKMAKIAKGTRQTHAAGSKVDMGLISSLALEAGATQSLANELFSANTARHAMEIVQRSGLTGFYPLLCERCVAVSKQRLGGSAWFEAVLVDFEGNVLGRYAG